MSAFHFKGGTDEFLVEQCDGCKRDAFTRTYSAKSMQIHVCEGCEPSVFQIAVNVFFNVPLPTKGVKQ